PDAIEGDGNYTYMHLKNIQTVNPSYTGGNSGTGYTGTSNVPMYYNLGAVSNAQGSPIVNGVSVQQGIGDSQNGTVNYCKSSSIDTDGDGIPDSTDIDDDNDGVLDTVEQSCVDTGSPLYRDYRPGVWSGAKDALSGVNYLASTGTYVQGYQDNGTESFTFTLVDLNPGIVNTLKYRFYTLNPQNPDANNVTLSINGTTLHSFSTIAGQSNPSSLSIDMGYRTISFTPTSTTATVKIQWSTPVNGLAGSDAQFREFQINGETKFECSDIDTDNDGIVNSLDLDSDGDKCPDAVEAGSASQAGNGNTSAGILINTITDGGIQTGTVNAIVGNGTPANYGNNGFYTGIENNDTFGANYTGTYTYSNAINKNVAACSTACYRPAVTAGTVLDTKQGITSLQRAGSDNENWPMVRKGAWTALESKTKGFVPNRLTTSEIGNIPAANLKEGMMVYNKDLDCLYINTDGTPTGWKCFNTQTCP
ncbi:hypothetical protein AB4Y90_11075, partial [Chryseobacterium sp. 2TAF14]|uniref:hypothetical protein n=1 Tax=Chryseobacterium sp. 2TAF14 TaxID=3233007 RepID=UPI003F8ED5F8